MKSIKNAIRRSLRKARILLAGVVLGAIASLALTHALPAFLLGLLTGAGLVGGLLWLRGALAPTARPQVTLRRDADSAPKARDKAQSQPQPLRLASEHPMFNDVVLALKQLGVGARQAKAAVEQAARDGEIEFDELFRRSVNLVQGKAAA